MNTKLLFSAAMISAVLTSSFAFSKELQSAGDMEYKLGNKVYKIPSSQAANVDKIIELIDSNNDVSEFGVNTFELESAQISSSSFNIQSGNLVVFSGYSATDVNAFDATFRFTCPSNMFLQRVSSYHENWAEDRRFSFECAKFKTASGSKVYRGRVSWSGYANEFDHALNYTCRYGEFLVGVYAEHENWAEDRRFKFACAAMNEGSAYGTQLEAEQCLEDGPSSLDRPWDLGSSRGALVGMKSEHVNWAEDRKTTVTYCLSANSGW